MFFVDDRERNSRRVKGGEKVVRRRVKGREFFKQLGPGIYRKKRIKGRKITSFRFIFGITATRISYIMLVFDDQCSVVVYGKGITSEIIIVHRLSS